MSRRVILFITNVAKGASYIKLPIKNQALVIIEFKANLCGIYGILAFLHPPRGNLNGVSKYTKYFHEN